MTSITLLRDALRHLARLLSKVQLSLVVASCALLVSFSQLYFGYLFDRSNLGGLVSDFRMSGQDLVEGDGLFRFSIRAHVAIALVNSGNRPSALLSVFLVQPFGFDRDCGSLSEEDSELVSPVATLFGLHAVYHALPIQASVVSPGSISIVSGELEIKETTRNKQDLGRDKPTCLLFLALDHRGRKYLTPMQVGEFSVYQNTTGFRPSAKLKSAISLLPQR